MKINYYLLKLNTIRSLPWDTTTLTGYIGEIIFDINLAEAFYIATGVLLLLFMSICLHHRAFYKRFQHSLRALDQPNEIENIDKFICDLIRFHISIKE